MFILGSDRDQRNFRFRVRVHFRSNVIPPLLKMTKITFVGSKAAAIAVAAYSIVAASVDAAAVASGATGYLGLVVPDATTVVLGL